MKCLNCGQNDSHFVPPSYGEAGFYLCAATTTPLTPMTLREQCEVAATILRDCLLRDMEGRRGFRRDDIGEEVRNEWDAEWLELIVNELIKLARQQQAVGLREAAKRLDEYNDDMGRFDPYLQKIVEWLEQQAREREGA